MPYNKNDIVTVTIEDIGSEGEGIGKIDGFTLFIKDAVIGDEVMAKIMKAKSTYAYARLETIITPSPFRVEPRCVYHRQCGGCQIQALNYQKQLEYKQKKIKNHLVRIGKFEESLIDGLMDPILGMDEPYNYRNKAQFPFGTNKDGEIVTGFYASHSHTIINNQDCAIGAVMNQEILDKIVIFMKDNQITAYDEETGRGLVRHALIRVGFTSGEIMVCLVINGNRLPASQKLIDSLITIPGMTSICISSNVAMTNVIMGNDYNVLWGQGYITDSIKDIVFQISPLSFYQVNPIQTEKLYSTALEYADLNGEETVWDLYCGIGTISLFLAKKAKAVYGVEMIPQAIADAKNNAKINNITNTYFYVGKAEEVLPEKYENEGIYADVIVVDPPRKGCDTQCLETMVKMQPKKIVYVSCDSATLARDLAYLCQNGYELKRIQGVDQFCHTVHCECVVLLTRCDIDDIG